MSPLILHLKSQDRWPIDASPIGSELFQSQPISVIAATPIQVGNIRVRLDEIFEVSGENATHIIIKDATDRIVGLGSSFSQGYMEVFGEVGGWLGVNQIGGEICVHGNAGDHAAAGMKGGMLKIDGNAGKFLGSTTSGARTGMRGGTVWVRGNVGDRVGDRMRRGIILIEGNAGSYLGARMIAGTMIVRGTVGPHLGFRMKRGTVILSQWPEEVIEDFCDVQGCELGYLRLLWDSLARLSPELSDFRQLGINVNRRFGDLSVGGMGEIIAID